MKIAFLTLMSCLVLDQACSAEPQSTTDKNAQKQTAEQRQRDLEQQKLEHRLFLMRFHPPI
jgi:hypothetical protein